MRPGQLARCGAALPARCATARPFRTPLCLVAAEGGATGLRRRRCEGTVDGGTGHSGATARRRKKPACDFGVHCRQPGLPAMPGRLDGSPGKLPSAAPEGGEHQALATDGEDTIASIVTGEPS